MMSQFYSIITALIITLSQQGTLPFSTIEKGFQTNDAEMIVGIGKSKMLLNIMGKNGAYSQSQAAQILKDFFHQRPSQGFKFIFKGKESEEGSFAIGTYKCKEGEYRVTIHFKKVNDNFLIESLSIE